LGDSPMIKSETMKIAAIDIGTNSIHMVIVRVEEHRLFEIIDREKEMVQLGKKTLMMGRLAEDAMERGLAALKAFRAIADSHGVDQIICTATSAVRESSNGKDFVAQIKKLTGIQVRILSGKEEARMIALAVRDVIDLKNRRALIVDIGGGSMELIVADARHIYFAESIKAGVIRLTERFMRHDPPAPKDLKKLQKWLKMKLEPLSKKIQNLSPELAVGTSGTILAMGALVAENRKNGKSKLQKDVMTLTEVELVNEKLQSMTMDQRMKLPSLDRKRADQIVAGGILIETVMEKCRMNEMTLCERALREGLIADFLIRRTPSVPAKIQARDLRGRSVLNLLNRWEIDRKHAEYTSKLALQLFDALANVHQMGPFEREVMEYSALLHDIGRVISYPGHHKHGWYIVKNANLVGFQVEELEMIAAIVRYHRKKAPKKKDSLLRPLPRRMRRAVILLSAILRIVDGLDRQHNQSIIQIEAKCETPRILRITLISDEPVPIALRAGLERAALLQKVLRIKRLEFGNEVNQSGVMKTETK